MKFLAYGMTDKGDTRKRNEDAFGIFDEENFYVVADGVGGHQGGEFAAKETVNHLHYHMQRVCPQFESCSEEQVQNLLAITVSETNQVVIKQGKKREELQGMASTFCFIFFCGSNLYYSHFGDSRIYLMREQKLLALTKDHTVAQELVDSNQSVVSERQKSILTKAIGLTENQSPSIEVQNFFLNDLYLLCSDGVYEGLNESQIESYLSQNKEPKTILQEIILGARNRGAKDNITAILIKITK